MFVVIYQSSLDSSSLIENPTDLTIVGQWQIDTTASGSVDSYADLATALDRVQHIREHGGEACLAVIID